MMDPNKKQQLEANGWVDTSVQDFLGLSAPEVAYIETKLKLSRFVKNLRMKKNLTQAGVAKQMGSSQSRVAKMENGDDSISTDYMLKAAYTIGATQEEVASALRD